MTETDEIDYERWMEQKEVWPREGGAEERRIEEMTPQHAIAAMHKVKRWSLTQRHAPEWDSEVMRSPLVLALLEQACGEEVVWIEDFTSMRDLHERTKEHFGRREAELESLLRDKSAERDALQGALARERAGKAPDQLGAAVGEALSKAGITIVINTGGPRG